MTRILAVVAATLLTGLVASGCAKSRCETVCDWLEECSALAIDDEECIEECVEEADDSGCADALKALADCLDGQGCGAGTTSCEGEMFDYGNECS